MNPAPLILFFKGGPGSGNHHHRGRPDHRGGSAPDPQYHLIEASLREHAAPWRHVDFSPQAWDAEFPNGQVHTPIGDIKLGENQRDKLSSRDRARYFGLIKPTLEAPTYIVVDHEPPEKVQERLERNETVERPSVFQFIRAFMQEDGRHQGFMCVTVSRDDLEILVSASPRKIARLARSVRNGAILTVGSALAGEAASPGREDGLNKAVSFEYLTAFDPESQQGIVICAWGLFKALIGFVPDEEPLLKRMSPDGESDAKSSTKAPSHHAPIPAGARWITVHPGGNKNAKGQPILVVPHPHKKGAYSVIGGAGGKLNYLKIRGLKSDQDYKTEAGERHAAKKLLEQQRIAADKKAGIHTGKTAAKQAITAQTQDAQRNLIAHVARMAGWQEAEITFPAEKYQHLSPKAYQAMQAKHHAGLLKQARQFIDLHRQQTLADSDRRAEALGAIPLTVSPDAPETLTVNDLDPIKPPDRGLGFNPDYRARAEVEAGSAEQLGLDVQAQRNADREPPSPEAEAARQDSAERRRDTAAELKAELERQAPPPKPKVSLETAQLNTQQVIDLLAADKQLRNIEKQAREKKGKIDEAKTLDETKAYNLTLGERPSGDEIVQDLKDQMRTGQTVAFLQRIEKSGSEDDLARHIGAGAAAAANSVGLTLGGRALMDRSVIDVLGISGAAQALARQLHASLSPEDLEDALAAMEAHHVETYSQRAEEAMSQADAWDELADIDSPDANDITDGHGIAAVESLNRQRIEALAESRRILGSALGEFEMNAAIITALKEGRPDRNFEVSLGAVTPKTAIVQLRALGLAPEHFKLDKIGDQQFATVTAAGLDQLARPVDRETLTRLRTAQDIIDGRQDEDGWLPSGVAKRPDLAMESQPGQAPKIAEPFAPSRAEDVKRGIEDYIGGRTADGDAPADILADLLSLPMMEKAEAVGSSKDAYMAAINAIAPSRDADNKLIRAEAHIEKFQALADQFVQSRYGNSRSPLHRQDMPLDDKTTDSLHRALSAHPAGVAGFKTIGDLTPQDQKALRQHFEKCVAKASKEADALKADLEKLDSNEPEKEMEDLLGEVSTNPAWQDWQTRRNDLAEQVNAATLDWGKYIKMMGGRKKAYAAIQDLIRSDVIQTFADSYNTLNPQAPLKVGRQVIRGNLQHLDAIDPVAREARLSQERKLIDSLRNRIGGQYSAGSVVEKIEAARDQQEASAQNQMGFFGDPEPVDDAPPEPLKADERHTLGHVIEQRLAGLCNTVGRNFKPGQAPVELFNLSMSGQYKNQQRAVKLILENKRVALAQGVGSGKSVISLGAFAELHAQGKVKKGVFCVPSIVQEQMHGEALRFLEAGKFKWSSGTGATRDERIAALKDPENHFSITTHQSLRDDLLYLGAQQAGMTEAALARHLDTQTPAQRAAWMKDLLAKEGINADYLMVDEGHNLLNREGKENSAMANVLDALSANASHYVNATADPIKNDVSEAFSLLEKMNPGKYNNRAEFMRRYGPDTRAAKDGLRRELLQHLYPGRIDPGVAAKKIEQRLDLNPEQHQAIADLDSAAGQIKLARIQGKAHIEAAKKLAPQMFKDAPEDQHEAIAKEVAKSAGVLKNAAVKAIIDRHPGGAKQQAVHQIIADRKGKPGVIFCHSLDAVAQLTEQLKAKGHRVVSMTGADSAQVKAQKKAQFNPDGGGEASADIMVTSDAGAVGMNAQRGQWLVQYDCPDTAMTHAQRGGRIHRLGQQNSVELIDLIANHPSEDAARKRLASKYELRETITSPYEKLDDTGLAHHLQQRRAERLDQGGLF